MPISIRVDFYILKSARYHLLTASCQLIAKAYAQQQRMHLVTQTVSQAQNLDRLLWTFNDIDFIPHELLISHPANHTNHTDLVKTPVLMTDIAYFNQLSLSPEDLLINLSDAIPKAYSNYKRIIEITNPTDHDRLSKSREKYRFYRDHTHELYSHEL